MKDNGRKPMADPKVKQPTFDFSDPETLLSVLDQINQQKQPAIDKLQKEIAENLEKLSRLGEDMLLISRAEYIELKNQTPAPVPKKQATKQVAKEPKAAAGPSANFKPEYQCGVCGIAGHHTRAHNFHKEKFTHEELVAKGLVPPEGTPEQPTLQ